MTSDLLNELRTYSCWSPTLEHLAADAAGIGRLQEACDEALRRLGEAADSSSNSSLAFVIPSAAVDDPAFAVLLEQELRRVHGLPARESSRSTTKSS